MSDFPFKMSHIRPESNFVCQNERRWNRVLELCNTEGAAPSPPGDDKWVVQAYRFTMAMREANGDPDAQRIVSNTNKDLYAAFELKGPADPMTRTSITQLIAQGVSYRTLAEQYAETPMTFRWYVKLWAADYDPEAGKPQGRLVNMTVRHPAALSSSFSSHNVEAFYAMFAVGFRPDTLWDLLERRELDEEGYERIFNAYYSILSYKAIHAVVNTQPNTFAGPQLMEQYQQTHRSVKEMELAAKMQGGSMADLVKYCIRGAAWTVMARGQMLEDSGKPNLKLLPGEFTDIPEPGELTAGELVELPGGLKIVKRDDGDGE